MTSSRVSRYTGTREWASRAIRSTISLRAAEASIDTISARGTMMSLAITSRSLSTLPIRQALVGADGAAAVTVLLLALLDQLLEGLAHRGVPGAAVAVAPEPAEQAAEHAGTLGIGPVAAGIGGVGFVAHRSFAGPGPPPRA